MALCGPLRFFAMVRLPKTLVRIWSKSRAMPSTTSGGGRLGRGERERLLELLFLGHVVRR